MGAKYACAEGTLGASELAASGVAMTLVAHVSAWDQETLTKTCEAAGCVRNGDACECQDTTVTLVGFTHCM